MIVIEKRKNFRVLIVRSYSYREHFLYTRRSTRRQEENYQKVMLTSQSDNNAEDDLLFPLTEMLFYPGWSRRNAEFREWKCTLHLI